MYEEEVLRDFLLDAGMVSRGQLDEALRLAQGGQLSHVLVERGMLSEDEVRKAVAGAHGIPFVTLLREDISLDALAEIPEPLARERSVVGYRVSEAGLEVALLDLAALEELEFLRPRYKILPRLTDRQSLKRALILYQRHLRERYGKVLESETDSAKMARLLILHALAQNASAAHFIPTGSELAVRYRINGTLRDAMTLPPGASGMLEAAFPKNGRVAADLGGGRDALVRVARMPWSGGVVLHFRPSTSGFGVNTLETLGLHGEALETLERALARRRGLVAIAGEGKSTLLAALKNILSSPEIAIAEARTSAQLRTALKADPDAVLVDGVRDREGAALAASGAARGIFVVAAEEGGDPPLLREMSPHGIFVRQKLVRKLCSKQFSHKRPLSRRELDALESHADFAKVLAALKEEGIAEKDAQWKDVAFARPVPCSECDSGYTGSVGLQEIFMQGQTIGLTLIEDGLFKAAQGLTSLEEILRLNLGEPGFKV